MQIRGSIARDHYVFFKQVTQSCIFPFYSSCVVINICLKGFQDEARDAC